MIGLGIGLGISRQRNAAAAIRSILYPTGAEQGGLYVEGLDVVFQDSAGTTAGAIGQPVGLELDLSRGLAMGSELMGLFAPFQAGTSTAATYDPVTGAGTAHRVDTANQGYVRITTPATANTAHRVRVTNTGATVITVRDQGGTPVLTIAAGATGEGIVYTHPSTPGLSVRCNGDGTSASFIIHSVRALPGNHLTQSTNNSRAILRADGSVYSVDLDGLDDHLTSATGGGGTGLVFCGAVRPEGGAGANRVIWSDAGTNTGYRLRLNTSNQLELSAGNGTAYTTVATAATVPVDETHVVTAWDDGTNLGVQIDGGTPATVARPTVSAGSAGFTYGRTHGAAGSHFNGRLYARAFRHTDCGTEARLQLQQHFARLAGI